MLEILIRYRDGDGEVTERHISDLHYEGEKGIDAFCHLRNSRRSFKIDRIVHAVDEMTGEVLNPYQLVAPSQDNGREPLDSVLWRAMPAIKALKFFTLSTRGFAKRERERVLQFLHENGDLAAYSEEEIADWLYKLWCGNLYAYRDGDVTEYAETLQSIPASSLDRCREYALLIARGSGRKPVDPMWLKRIELEFNQTPVVEAPERRG